MPNKSKISISDAQLKNELIKLFESGNSAKTELLGIFRNKYKIGTDRFLREFNLAYETWQIAKNKSTVDTIQANQKESLKSGLKQKIDIQKEIQEEIEQLQKILADGYLVKKVTFSDGTTANKREVFGTREIESYHRMIDAKRTELIKLDGMYAPTKTANTDKDGNDVSDPLATLIKSGGGIKIITKH